MSRHTEVRRARIIEDLTTMSVADAATNNCVSRSTVYRIQRAERSQIGANIDRANRVNRGWKN